MESGKLREDSEDTAIKQILESSCLFYPTCFLYQGLGIFVVVAFLFLTFFPPEVAKNSLALLLLCLFPENVCLQ